MKYRFEEKIPVYKHFRFSQEYFMFVLALNGWSPVCGLLLTSGICKTQPPLISFQVFNLFFFAQKTVLVWERKFFPASLSWHLFKPLQVLMLQVMMIHWKTKLHLSQDSNQLFKISKLTKIVTLCHQENTSKQKYKMINTFTKSGKFVQNKPVN